MLRAKAKRNTSVLLSLSLLLLLLLPISSLGASAASALIDVTVTTRPGLPVFESATGLARSWRTLAADLRDGDAHRESYFLFSGHTGTHVDAPAHFLADAAADTVDKLDLAALVGAALVVNVPRGANISARVLDALNIAPSVERVIFKTENTDK
jgi:kynurenine formamidase